MISATRKQMVRDCGMQKRSPDYLDERAGLQVLSHRAGPRQEASAHIYTTPALWAEQAGRAFGRPRA